MSIVILAIKQSDCQYQLQVNGPISLCCKVKVRSIFY